MTLTEAEVVRASIAALVGVGCLLVLLRWLPASVSLLLGAAVGVGAFAVIR